MSNPWISVAAAPLELPVPEAPVPIAARPPFAEVRPVGGLKMRDVVGDGGLFVVSAHGGAGGSAWASLLGGADAGQVWPLPDSGHVRAIVVARWSFSGLQAAHTAALQWAAGQVPGVYLVGLILVPDAPGKQPGVLRDLTQKVSGAFPTVWVSPWVEQWRTDVLTANPIPKGVAKIITKIGGQPPQREETK